MTVLKKSKIREMTDDELKAKLFEFQKELNSERGMLATGGRTSNPGKISELRHAVARLITIMHERKLGIKHTPAAKKATKAAYAAKAPEAAKVPEKKTDKTDDNQAGNG